MRKLIVFNFAALYRPTLAELMEERRQKKAGRLATLVSIRCDAMELRERIKTLKEMGFELDTDYARIEVVDATGPLQRVMLLHLPEKLKELVVLEGVTVENQYL